MNKTYLKMAAILAGLAMGLMFSPEEAYALGTFESKMERLRDALVGTLLPLVSTIGLVYVSILAVAGSEESRRKMIGIIIMSIVGFMAQYIIDFIKGIAG